MTGRLMHANRLLKRKLAPHTPAPSVTPPSARGRAAALGRGGNPGRYAQGEQGEQEEGD